MKKHLLSYVSIVYLFSAISITGMNQVVIKKVIKHLLPENPVIIDAGAHMGGDTCELATTWPKGTVYAFEPMPNLYAHLVKNTKSFSNIKTFPLALSDKSGRADFYVSSGSSDCSSSLLAPKDHLKYHPDVYFKSLIQVDVLNLDEWAGANGVSRIDFMWLDMQGSELAMLKAAPKILQTVSVIFMEVNFYEVYEGCPLYAEVKEWFENQGFRVIHEEFSWVDFGNVLFVRKK